MRSHITCKVIHEIRAYQSQFSHRAKVVNIIAVGWLAADSEEEVLRPLVVGAPHLHSNNPVDQNAPEVGLPNGLYCGCV